LLLKAWHNIVDPTTSVTSNIGDLADVVEHVTTDEQQNNHEGDSSPEITALKNGREVGPSSYDCRDDSEHSGDRDYPACVVDRPLDAGMRSVRKRASKP
jgi:hypothetical protein